MTYPRTPINFLEADAIEVICRSADLHPGTFMEAIKERADRDREFMQRRHDMGPMVRKAVDASRKAAEFAYLCIERRDFEPLKDDMAAGIIATDLACRLQCVPRAIMATIVARTWPL